MNTSIEQSLRAGDKLLVSFVNPHHHISRDALSRWLKTVLDLAGIDLNKFSGHSTRTASASAAFSRNVPLDILLTTAGWSRQILSVSFSVNRVQGLCESRGGRPGLPVLMNLMVSVDVKQH